jgi:hypothetical protein
MAEGKSGGSKAKQMDLFDRDPAPLVKITKPESGMPKLVSLRKEHSYYRDLAKRLLDLAEKEELETEDGKNKPYFRASNLHKIFRALHKEVDENLDTLKNLGFLRPKETEPEGWYICPEGYEVNFIKPLRTKKLRNYARRLYNLSGYEEIANGHGYKVRRHKKSRILSWLMQQGEAKPLEVLEQMENKCYLRLAGARENADSYYVCQTQNEGRSF